MYFSRLNLTHKGLSVLLSASEYGLHRALWTLFADRPDRERDFLYRRMDEGPRPEFLCLSARAPVNDGRWSVETKAFEPRFRAGQVLEFSLRANPVRTQWVDGKQKRRDVVMDHKKRLEARGLPREQWPTGAAIVQEAGAAWILERAERWGIRFDCRSLRADGYRVLDFTKNGGGQRRQVRLATVEFSGVLEIVNPGLLRDVMATGVGPAKGFGCGLLLLKPSRS